MRKIPTIMASSFRLKSNSNIIPPSFSLTQYLLKVWRHYGGTFDNLFLMLIKIIFCLIFSLSALADQNDKLIKSFQGSDSNERFTFHQPNYFIFGEDDLKLQFSFKYRVAKTANIFLAYSQLMFWNIYDESKPFADVNYRPEIFYRILEHSEGFFRSGDIGWLHASNGREGDLSRSLDRVFLRTNVITKLNHHLLGASFMVYHIYNEDETNQDIVKHLGYWEANLFMSGIIRDGQQHLDLEVRTYAGSKVINFDQGAFQVGLIYNMGSENFNPSFYFQRFEGYSENLLAYNQRRTEYRLGLMLGF